jgi:hypothetical protein
MGFSAGPHFMLSPVNHPERLILS